MTNEEANRRAKAVKIAEHLRSTRPDLDAAIFDARMGDRGSWSLWAMCAGLPAGRVSEATREETISILVGFASAATADPFAGLPR